VVHDWETTAWMYDDTFFRCRKCGLKTHCRRGTPARTVAECAQARIAPCDPVTVALTRQESS
jgi:hypothetical protein